MKFVEGLVFLFKGMLFLDGHLTHGALLDEPFRSLGNKAESDRVFGPAFAKREAADEACLPAGCN